MNSWLRLVQVGTVLVPISQLRFYDSSKSQVVFDSAVMLLAGNACSSSQLLPHEG